MSVSTEKENCDVNITNCDVDTQAKEMMKKSPTKKTQESKKNSQKEQSHNKKNESTNNDDKSKVDISLVTFENEAEQSNVTSENEAEQSYVMSENEAEQSYVMSENEDTSEDEEDDSPDCPEIQKLIESDKTMKEHLEFYANELLLVDESPEERKEIDDNPERPVLTMRNTSSSSIMHGLIAGWIMEVKKHPKGESSVEPDMTFRRLLALSLSMFRDDHWIGDTDSPDIVYFLVKELGNLWKNTFKKTDSELKITATLRTEVKEIFKYYKRFMEELSTAQGWEHPIEFIYTTTRPKHKVPDYDLAEVVQLGKEIMDQKISMRALYAEPPDEKSGEPEAKKAK